jgi:hypothetical protein
MKKVALVVAIVLCLMLAGDIVYFRTENLWDRYLSKNAEHLLVLFKDGWLYAFTENEEARVSLPDEYLFEKSGKRVEDILIFIHNHLRIGRVSGADKLIYAWLKKRGFTGKFLIRLGNDTVIEYTGE